MRHRTALLVSVSGNILAGLLYTFAVIQVLGAGSASDAYFLSLTVTTFFLAIFAVPLNSVVTARLAASHSAEQWRVMAWAGHIGAVVIYLPITIMIIATADIWLSAMLPGMRDMDLHKQLLVLQVVAMFFAGIQSSALAAVQSQRKFLTAEATAFGCAVLFYLPFVAALTKHGIVAASEVQLCRAFVQLVILLAMSGRPAWQGTQAIMRDLIWQFRFPVVGGIYYKTDAVLDRYLLSHAKDGLLSVYHLVQQVISIISALYAKSFISPLLVAATEDIKSRSVARLKKRIQKHLIISACIMAACIASSCVAIWMAAPLARLLHLDFALIVNAAGVLIALSGVILGGLAGQVSNAVYYAAGQLSTPVWVGITSYTIFIPLKILAFSTGGITGLSLVASLYYLVNAVVLHLLQIRLLKRVDEHVAAS